MKCSHTLTQNQFCTKPERIRIEDGVSYLSMAFVAAPSRTYSPLFSVSAIETSATRIGEFVASGAPNFPPVRQSTLLPVPVGTSATPLPVTEYGTQIPVVEHIVSRSTSHQAHAEADTPVTECVTSVERNFEDTVSVCLHSSTKGFAVRGLEHTRHELTRTQEYRRNNQLSLESCCATSDASADPLVDSDSGHVKTDLLVEHIDPWLDEYENIPERSTEC